jgi:hypothetical protein
MLHGNVDRFARRELKAPPTRQCSCASYLAVTSCKPVLVIAWPWPSGSGGGSWRGSSV